MVANESLKTDGFCGENINKQVGEAPTTAADFQYQEKIDLHVSSIEFKEVDIVEANNSETTTVDSVKQVTKKKTWLEEIFYSNEHRLMFVKLMKSE